LLINTADPGIGVAAEQAATPRDFFSPPGFSPGM
jgi:hypothetical protein